MEVVRDEGGGLGVGEVRCWGALEGGPCGTREIALREPHEYRRER